MLRRLVRIPGLMKLESGLLHGHKPCCQLHLGRLSDARWRSLAAAAKLTCRQDRLRCSAAAASAGVSAQQQQTESLPPSHAQQSMSWAGRDHNCGELREGHAGQQMTICGWVHRHRNLGGVLFCDIRDSTGILQVGLLCPGAPSSLLPVALHCSGQGRPERHKAPYLVQPACCFFQASALRRHVVAMHPRCKPQDKVLAGRHLQAPLGANALTQQAALLMRHHLSCDTLSPRCLQVISQPAEHPEAHAALEGIRSEYCVRITGTLCKRRDPNTRIPTGLVELSAERVSVLNAVTARLPFLPSDEKTPLSEEVRLRHRVLDLR